MGSASRGSPGAALRHVVHVAQSGGGVETHILSIIGRLGPPCFTHSVVCPGDHRLVVRARAAGAGVVPVPMCREIAVGPDLASLWRVAAAVRRLHPDLIHAHSGKGGVFGRVAGLLCRVPVVFTPNAFSYLESAGWKRRLVLGVERALAHVPATLIPSSPSEARRAVGEVGWRPERLRLGCWNVIPVTDYRRPPRPPGVVRVVSVGRLGRQKDPLRLLRVAERVVQRFPGVEFVVVGAGYGDELGDEFERARRSSPAADKVHVEPWGPAEGVRRHLELADIYLTVARYEGLPFTLLEALDAELPIVASRVDGNVDVVEHGSTGILANTDEELADAVARLAADPELRATMGRAGKTFLRRRFDVSACTSALERAYWEAVRDFRRGR